MHIDISKFTFIRFPKTPLVCSMHRKICSSKTYVNDRGVPDRIGYDFNMLSVKQEASDVINSFRNRFKI